MQSKEELIRLQQEREEFRNYAVHPYIASVGDLSTDGVVEKVQELRGKEATNHNATNELQADERMDVGDNLGDNSNDYLGDESLQEVPKKIPEVFVVINSLECKIESNKIVDAVQYCLKCITVLNKEYPPECKHVWEFIALEVCKLPGKAKYTSVKNLILDLKNLKKGENKN